jgi:hypothetical protein
MRYRHRAAINQRFSGSVEQPFSRPGHEINRNRAELPSGLAAGHRAATEAASLVGIRPALNEWRYYRMEIWPDLFGRALLVRHWGRIGTEGHRRLDPHPDPGAAINDSPPCCGPNVTAATRTAPGEAARRGLARQGRRKSGRQTGSRRTFEGCPEGPRQAALLPCPADRHAPSYR